MKKQKDYTILALLIPFLIACLFSCTVSKGHCPTNDPKFFFKTHKHR